MPDQNEHDVLISDLAVALGFHSTETLMRIRDAARKINPEGWLPKLIVEYLETWR